MYLFLMMLDLLNVIGTVKSNSTLPSLEDRDNDTMQENTS